MNDQSSRNLNLISQLDNPYDTQFQSKWEELPKWRSPVAISMTKAEVPAIPREEGQTKESDVWSKHHRFLLGCSLAWGHVPLADTHWLRPVLLFLDQIIPSSWQRGATGQSVGYSQRGPSISPSDSALIMEARNTHLFSRRVMRPFAKAAHCLDLLDMWNHWNQWHRKFSLLTSLATMDCGYSKARV